MLVPGRARRGAVVGLLAIGGLIGCAGRLGKVPQPPLAPVSADDYVAVPFGPRTPPPEYVPPSPSRSAVWMDGSWEWGGGRYTWRYGSWVIPPPNARYAPWVLVRRAEDGQLFFAPSDWKDEGGHSIADRAFETALGPAARARARPDGPPASDVQVGRPHGGAPSNGAREGGEEEDEGL